MLQQNELFRQIGLGSFKGLAMRVTINPAMLALPERAELGQGLAERELRPRDDGALHARRGQRLHRARRPRAGARADRLDGRLPKNGLGWVHFHFKRENHDDAMKVVFGKAGPFNWKTAVRLCIEHPKHPAYFVNKLWSYFIPVPPGRRDGDAARELYVHSGYQIRPVVTAILRHPLLYEGPRMVKSPVVYTAGLLRTRGDRIETEDWIYLDAMAGQQLFYPPNVSGWNDDRWLDTSTFRARWLIARRALQKHALNPDHARPADRPPADPEKLVDSALGWWGSLRVSPHTRAALLDYAQKTMAAAIADEDRQKTFPLMTYNALRHLAAVSPEMQTA